MKPQLVVLAGPNGAGKTTFYEEFLSGLRLPFLNADAFEAQTGIPSIEAARMLDAIREELIGNRTSYITETVFSDPFGSKLALLKKAVEAGYEVALIYIAVEPPLSAARIDQRVAIGGHDVPRDRIASRFKRSIVNLRKAIRFVPLVKIYDNSSVHDPFQLIAIYKDGERTFISEAVPRWAQLGL